MSGIYTSGTVHCEIVLEEHIVAALVGSQGYRERNSDTDYDRTTALDRALVLEFIRSTQPEAWTKLEQQYTTAAEAEFFKQLESALKGRSTLDVLRNGIKLIPGIYFSLCYFQPASNLNAELVRLYEATRLSAMRQVRYSTKSENRLIWSCL